MSKSNLGLHRKQLKKLANQLREVLAQSSGEINTEAEALMRRIRTLISQIRGFMSRREIARILGVAAVFFGLGYAGSIQAQNFDNPVADPFGISKSNYFNIPTAVDIDGDGDLDLFTGAIDLSGGYYPGPVIQFHENTGTAQMAQFAAPVNDTFNIDISTLTSYIAMPTFGDLDGDGDYDMMAGGSYFGLFYFENTGTAQSPSFTAPVANPFGMIDTVYYGAPILLDLDDDGDLDLLSGDYGGRIVYYENTGSATSPAFGVKQYEPFGLQPTYYAYPTAGDVDWDGDLDLIVGDYYGDMQYFENTGTRSNPQFAAPVTNPSNIQSGGSISFPALADMDGDSDMDLLVGVGSFYTGVSFNYYENLVTAISIDEFNEATKVYPTIVQDIVRIDTDLEFNSIQLIGMSGGVLKTWNPELREINLGDFPKGAYQLELSTESGQVILKKLLRK
jgi:hypothetical protein